MYTIAVLLKFPDFPVTMMAAELSASTMQKLEACFSPFRRRQYRIGINQRRGVSSSTLRVLILRYNITFRLILVGYVIYHHDIITYQSQSIPPCISLSIYIKYKYVCVYIYVYIPQSTTFFLTVWFFKTLGCCHPRYALLVPKAGRPRRGFQLRHGTTCSEKVPQWWGKVTSMWNIAMSYPLVI